MGHDKKQTEDMQEETPFATAYRIVRPHWSYFPAITVAVLVSCQLPAAPLTPGQVVRWGKVMLPHVNRGTVFTGIAAGSTHTLAIKADGNVVGRGRNYAGEAAIPPGKER